MPLLLKKRGQRWVKNFLPTTVGLGFVNRNFDKLRRAVRFFLSPPVAAVYKFYFDSPENIATIFYLFTLFRR